jgi:hypothetical protein
MKYLKLFEEFGDGNEEYNEEYYSEAEQTLTNLIEGYPMKMSDLDIFYDYFGGEIPNEYKYNGYLFRYMFFDDEESYNNALENGVECRPDYFLRCTTNTDSHDIIIDSLGAGYEYYILFEVDVPDEKIIFDVNTLANHFGFRNEYGHEEEVIVDCIKLEPSDISENGEIE